MDHCALVDAVSIPLVGVPKFVPLGGGTIQWGKLDSSVDLLPHPVRYPSSMARDMYPVRFHVTQSDKVNICARLSTTCLGYKQYLTSILRDAPPGVQVMVEDSGNFCTLRAQMKWEQMNRATRWLVGALHAQINTNRANQVCASMKSYFNSPQAMVDYQADALLRGIQHPLIQSSTKEITDARTHTLRSPMEITLYAPSHCIPEPNLNTLTGAMRSLVPTLRKLCLVSPVYGRPCLLYTSDAADE